jgi:hypothetical protein
MEERLGNTCLTASQLGQCFVELIFLILIAGVLYTDGNILTPCTCYATENRADLTNKSGLAALFRVESLQGAEGGGGVKLNTQQFST